MSQESSQALPPDVQSWTFDTIGDFEVLATLRATSKRTGVWHIRSDRDDYYLKTHSRRARWGTEVFAYRDWGVAFRPFLPELVAVFEGQTSQGILLSSVDGVPLRECDPAPEDMRRPYSRAGRLCRRLHDLPLGLWFGSMDQSGHAIGIEGDLLACPPADASGYYCDAISQHYSRARELNCLSLQYEGLVQGALASAESLQDVRPTPTHRDFTPGNWLVDMSGELVAIIDLENMVWGLRVAPFVRLLVDYFPFCPQGEEAFYEEFGSRPPHENPEQVLIGATLLRDTQPIGRSAHEGQGSD